MNKLWQILVLVTLTIFSAQAQVGRNVDAYNDKQGPIGLVGYDPVSYFAEGGGEPLEGDSSIALDYEGVVYHFATVENKETFLTNPEKYEPTYGGWCAWGMANNATIEIDPEIYTIDGDRIHFFVGRRAKRNFDRDVALYTDKADDNWEARSGEAPRNK